MPLPYQSLACSPGFGSYCNRLSDKRDTANHEHGKKNGLNQHYANRRWADIGQRLE
jgi:hypothetical protein